MERVSTSNIRVLLTFARQASTLSAAQRKAMETDVTVFLRRAWDFASADGRNRYNAWVQAKKPASAWEAVTGHPGAPPPMLVLLREQVPALDPTDDYGIGDGPEWAPLRTALDTWDTKTIERWLGADGWRPPGKHHVPFMPLDDLAHAPPSGPKKAPPPAPKSLSSGVILGGLAGAAAIGGLGVWLMSQRRRPKTQALPPAEVP